MVPEKKTTDSNIWEEGEKYITSEIIVGKKRKAQNKIKQKTTKPNKKTLVGKIPWRREWLPTSEFFPGEFHGQRSLAGYRP